MELSAWISTFRKLHEKARRKELDEIDQKTYVAGRDELARALVVAQRLTLKTGETPRQALRVARALAIDLDLASGRVRALTQDLSRGGFSALVEKPPTLDDLVGFTLRIPGGVDPVIGRCKLVDAAKRQGNFRASFAFQALGEAEQERIEMILFDTVLEQFRGF
ncbi:MAG TPA: PilZ domain-containing protein [Myxococcales bacterium]|nr:PilZ domain-containing protein [Myxococcales bacterium]